MVVCSESVETDFGGRGCLEEVVGESWCGRERTFFVACDELRGLGGICPEYKMWLESLLVQVRLYLK